MKSKHSSAFVMKRLIQIISVNVVLVMLGVELLGVGWYFGKHGDLFYARDREAALHSPDAQTAPLGARLHPYLGFVLPAGRPYLTRHDSEFIARQRSGGSEPGDWTDVRTNGLGFLSPFAYPYSKQGPRDFVVGVFGGSVANYFALQGRERLKARLQEHPAFHDRTITVLNFAMNVHKQPQQAATLGFLLTLGQTFDLVVNIDGFNEVVAGLRNVTHSVDTSMPSMTEFAPLFMALRATSTGAEGIRELRRLLQARQRIRQLNVQSQSCYSAGLNFLLHLWLRYEERIEGDYHDSETDQLNAKTIAESAYAVVQTNLSVDSEEAIDRLFLQWRNAAIAMHEIARGRDIPYLQVLQPNQYYSAKPFSASERRAAFVDDLGDASPESGYVRRGYGRFPEFVERLSAAGVEIRSAVDLFDQIEQTVYVDTCCHFNQRGYDVLADFVAGAVEEMYSQ